MIAKPLQHGSQKSPDFIQSRETSDFAWELAYTRQLDGNPRRGLVNFARPRPRRASRKRVGLDRRTPKTTCQASKGIEKPTQHTVGTVVFYQPLTYEQSKFNNQTDESANIMLAFIDMKTPCGKPWLCDCEAAKKAAEAVPLMCAEVASRPVAARNDIGKRVDLDDCSRAI